MKIKNLIFLISALIASFGAINWLTTSYGYNMVGAVSPNPTAQKAMYTIVGIAGFIVIFHQVRWLMSSKF